MRSKSMTSQWSAWSSQKIKNDSTIETAVEKKESKDFPDSIVIYIDIQNQLWYLMLVPWILRWATRWRETSMAFWMGRWTAQNFWMF